MADLLFVGQFVASKAGKTGLTVTIDVDRYTLADGSRAALVTAGSATEGRRGLYHYRLASADLATYQYVATFITADATVDQQEIAALGLVVPDALVSSRLAPATAGRTLEVAATGEAAANVTLWAGDAVAGAPALETTLQAILEDTGTTLPGLFAASGATVTVISAVDGGRITVYVADTWSFTVTDSTLDLSGYETVALSVKRDARQADADALLYLRSDTGLQRVGGAAPVLAGNGTLTKTSTSFAALVALAETAGLQAGRYTWWLKGFDTTPAPDTGFTLATGEFVLERAGLQAVS